MDPRDLGIARARMEDLLGGTPEENAAVVRRVLQGEEGPVRDIVLLNTAAGIVTYDLVRAPETVDRPILERLRNAFETAATAIDSGAALSKLDAWVSSTQRHSLVETPALP